MVRDRPVTEADHMAALPEDVRSTAIWLDNGEVMWPFEVGQLVVDALVSTGHVILGVDARERHDAGRVTEVAISDYWPTGDASDVENSHRAALAAIARAEAVTGWEQPNILLTWR
jgi:hypothetical protein